MFYSERDEIVDYQKVFSILARTSAPEIQAKNYKQNKHALILENPEQIFLNIMEWLAEY